MSSLQPWRAARRERAELTTAALADRLEGLDAGGAPCGSEADCFHGTVAHGDEDRDGAVLLRDGAGGLGPPQLIGPLRRARSAPLLADPARTLTALCGRRGGVVHLVGLPAVKGAPPSAS